MKNTKQYVYGKSLLKYGFLSLCFLINEYVINEDYEEAAIIFGVLQDFNEKYEMSIPTIWNDESIEYFKNEVYKITKTSGDISLNNISYYIDDIKKELNKLN